MPQWIITILTGGGAVGLFALIGNAMGWVRFRKKDDAQVYKVHAETQVDLAEASNKKIDDEVKISKAALEWTVQLASQLEKANILNDKRQEEIDRLHELIQQMKADADKQKADFDKRMKEVEDVLDANQNELNVERQKNQDLLSKLNQFINGTGK